MKKKMMCYRLSAFISFVILLLPFISSEISLGQLNNVYSIGDELSLNVSLMSSSPQNDFLIIMLNCPSGSSEIYKSAYFLKANEQKNIKISARLDKTVVGDLIGTCKLQAYYSEENAESQLFSIGNQIDVQLSINSPNLMPDQQVTISGIARKNNGEKVNGFIEASINDLELNVVGLVQNGIFNVTLTAPSSARAGSYTLNTKVYEKNQKGEVTNEGSATALLKIPQIIKNIDIALSSSSIHPGKSLTYTALLYDQTDMSAYEDVGVIIYKPDGNIFLKKLVKAGEPNVVLLTTNSTPGYWQIESNIKSLQAKRSFYLEKFENISLTLINQTLIITNTGNVPYQKLIEITIGNEKEWKEISLNVGEVKKLKLKGDGEYTIKVSDGDSIRDFGRVALTGGAIGVSDLDSFFSGSKYKGYIWLLIIVVLFGIAIFWYTKLRKNKYYGKIPSFSRNDRESQNKANNLNKQQSTLVGKKEEVIITALKIKNIAELISSESEGIPLIEQTLQKAKAAKAYVYEQGDYKIIVFSPSKITDAEMPLFALTVSKDIDSLLQEHNKKYALKISYGIGINMGEMIVEWRDGKPTFTSLGTTVVSAKRAAEKANDALLITDNLKRKVSSGIKYEKVAESNLWSLTHIIHKTAHEEFINKFMKRQSEDKSRKAGFIK